VCKVDGIENLLKARSFHAYGMQRDYLDHPNCIGWTREGDDDHTGCAVVLSNDDNGDKNMEIGKRYAGKKFIDLMGKNPGEVAINMDGWGNFLAPAGSISVWIEKE
jgi:alpha-amylase